MKKIILSLCLAFLFHSFSSAQLIVSKLVGKDSKNYGLGFGLFAFLDIPLASGNQSIRIELADINYYPAKGQAFFTGEDGIGYVSIRLGYKYVFSETQSGFYILPSAGYGAVIDPEPHEEKAREYHGVATAMEGGYSIGLGESGHMINLGLKYEYDINKTKNIQSLGFRVSYSFGLFGRRE